MLETYLGASRLDMLLAKAVYGFSMLEFALLMMLRKIKRREYAK